MFKNPRFVKTAVFPKDYPILRNPSGQIMPEIAIVGRSNVGKSTLINHLLNAKGLAKTSATPGKTQAINFFAVDDKWGMVDLPGYGYAKVPLNTRKSWGTMIERYLTQRESLKLILFLFDIRRIPNEEDIQLLEWIVYHQKMVVLVLTKVDKVGKNERMANTKKILEAFGAENLSYIHYSATKNIGRDQLKGALNEIA